VSCCYILVRARLNMVHPLLLLAGAYLAAESYKRYVSPEKKAEWEDYIKSHHGEWGALAGILGAITGHYGIAAAGVGLALHDINDISKWFTGNKSQNYS